MGVVTVFLEQIDQTISYLKDHLDPEARQQLQETYQDASALEIMANAVAVSCHSYENAMKRAFGPLMRFCGAHLQQHQDASLDIYLMFSGLWWDAETYTLKDVVPIFEEGITRYPASAQLQFNVGNSYLYEANCAYVAQRWNEVVQYVPMGIPYLETACTLDPKLSSSATRMFREMRHRCHVAEKQLEDREIGGN